MAGRGLLSSTHLSLSLLFLFLSHVHVSSAASHGEARAKRATNVSDVSTASPFLMTSSPGLLTSCAGPCGQLLSSDEASCFCDFTCEQFSDCCHDYASLCGDTCAGNCDRAALFCRCDDSCVTFNDCCRDYMPICTNASADFLRERLSCPRGSHRLKTEFGSPDLLLYQIRLSPNPSQQNALQALTSNAHADVTLRAGDCYVIAPRHLLQLHKACLDTQGAHSIELSVQHEGGVYSSTRRVRSPDPGWSRNCFRVVELQRVAEVKLCLERPPQVAPQPIRMRDVDVRFCRDNELTASHY